MSSLSAIKSSSSSCIAGKMLPKEISQILEFISFGVAMFDEQKRLIYHNQTLRTIFQIERLDNLANIIMSLSNTKKLRKLSSFNSVTTPSQISNITELLDKLTTKDDEKTCEFFTHNKTIWVKGKMLHLDNDVRYIITFADVTLQRECEMLKEINKMKSKIISSLSHEIRNPLHNILESLNNCLKNPNEIIQNIRIANSNSHFILFKINDLLVYSNIGLFAIRN